MSLDSLKPFLEPRSIAMIGASENPNKIGGRPIAYLQRYGFKGKVYPINPTRKELQGQACYPSLADVPEVPDLAVVAVPGDNAIAAVKDCAARGVKAAIVMSSGFGETSAPEGKAKEREMVEAARAAGMRMVGPNTQGLANFGNGAVASFSTLFTAVPQADGPIAMVPRSRAASNSGICAASTPSSCVWRTSSVGCVWRPDDATSRCRRTCTGSRPILPTASPCRWPARHLPTVAPGLARACASTPATEPST
jgi:predicted CoA-binding protein